MSEAIAEQRPSGGVIPTDRTMHMGVPANDAAVQKIVDQEAEHGPGEIIDCTTPERFVIVIRKLFEISKKRIGAYSDHVCRKSTDLPVAGIKAGLPYWSDPTVIEAACVFLERSGSSLEMIVGKKLDSRHKSGIAGNEFVKAVIEHAARVGTVHIYLSNNRRAGRSILAQSNFVVADDNGYRLETTSVRQKAVTRFHRPEINKSLFATFDTMKGLLDRASSGPVSEHAPIKLEYDAVAKSITTPSLIRPHASIDSVDWSKYLLDESDPKDCDTPSTLVQFPSMIEKRVFDL